MLFPPYHPSGTAMPFLMTNAEPDSTLDQENTKPKEEEEEVETPDGFSCCVRPVDVAMHWHAAMCFPRATMLRLGGEKKSKRKKKGKKRKNKGGKRDRDSHTALHTARWRRASGTSACPNMAWDSLQAPRRCL